MKSILLLAFLLAAAPVSAQSFRPLSIPTRVTDAGKQNLAADLYATDTTTPKPVVLIQTPYDKNYYRLGLGVFGANGASVPYDSAHYNYVIVDWRGFYANKAAGITPYNRGLDGYDIVEWIAKQAWSNGKIGTWGGSALGSIQFLTAAQHPPHLVCAAPFIYDFKTEYPDYYYGGDFRKEHAESLEKLGFTTVQLILSHPTEDAYWLYAAQQTDVANQMTVPLFMASGWFDHFPSDVIRTFDDLRGKSDASVRARHKLLFGPWGHTEMGVSKQGMLDFPNAANVPVDAGARFFDYYLRGIQNGWDADPTVRYYQMGDDQWRTTNDWHAVGQYDDTLYIGQSGRLNASRANAAEVPDTLAADPRVPVPTIGGSRFNPFDKTVLTGPQDVSALLSRSDALVYSTPPLPADLPIDGPTQVKLYFTSDRQDADLSARLCDVYPDGRWIILTQGMRRLRFRRSVSTQQLLVPGAPDSCTITLQELGITFKQGHRIGILLSGSNYPMFDLNLNNGAAMYAAGDTLTARTLVRHTDVLRSAFIFRRPSKTTGVTGGGAGWRLDWNAIVISPNPAGNLVQLSLENPGLRKEVGARVEIINAMGQTVLTAAAGRLPCNVDIGGLPRGIYAVRMDGMMKMFVKE